MFNQATHKANIILAKITKKVVPTSMNQEFDLGLFAVAATIMLYVTRFLKEKSFTQHDVTEMRTDFSYSLSLENMPQILKLLFGNIVEAVLLEIPKRPMDRAGCLLSKTKTNDDNKSNKLEDFAETMANLEGSQNVTTRKGKKSGL